MQPTVYRNADGFETLAQEWDELLARSSRALLFMRHVYQRTWWRYLGNDDLVLIAIRRDNGQLVGLAPLNSVLARKPSRCMIYT
ncbi:MAG: hypothetical protein JXM69_12775 [Anaerolineae bacterium]|nr:hypothetical protein [Anaerolineae bacterium]